MVRSFFVSAPIGVGRREANPRSDSAKPRTYAEFEPRRDSVLEDLPANRRADRGSARSADRRSPPPPLQAQSWIVQIVRVFSAVRPFCGGGRRTRADSGEARGRTRSSSRGGKVFSKILPPTDHTHPTISTNHNNRSRFLCPTITPRPIGTKTTGYIENPTKMRTYPSTL